MSRRKGRRLTKAECRHLFARLSEHLDGELPAGLCEQIRAHLDGCAPCEAFTRSLRRTVDLCRQLPRRPLPEGLRREIRALLEDRRVR